MKQRAFVLLFALSLGLHQATARPMIGLTASNQLVTFDSATPGTLSAPIAISGLVSGDSIHALDYRPRNGVLYGLAINNTAGTDTGRIYTINAATGVATQVGATPFSTTLIDASLYGFDVNPSADVIRVTNSNDQNLRVNPDTGLLVATDAPLDYAAGNESITAIAYDRNDRNPGTLTTLFGINFQTDQLVLIGGVNGSPSPNGGVVTPIGPLGIVTDNANIGFDIAEDGIAYVSAPDAGLSRFYTINLATGAVTLLGSIGAGTTVIRDVTTAPSLVANIDSGEFFSSIQTAVNDAQTFDGHTIVVNAATFSQTVTVTKSLTILGAQSGVSGTSSLRGVNESIVRGAATAGGRNSAFIVQVDNVTIDGFTTQEYTDGNGGGASIVLASGVSGGRIRNNIIKNNIAGLIISNDVASNPLIVESNYFLTNNAPGPVGGTAIYTDQFLSGSTLTSVSIRDNGFESNDNAGVLLGSTLAGSQGNIGIENNIISDCGNAVLVFNLANSFISGNSMSGSLGSQIVIGGGVTLVDISQNFIINGMARGIRIGDFGGGSANSNVVIGSNYIEGNTLAGLEVDSAANVYSGSVLAQNNWWGNSSGPTNAGNPGGTGQTIVTPAAVPVLFLPFLGNNSDLQISTPGFQAFPAPELYGINPANNNLVRFNAATPSTVTSVPISGTVGGEAIIGLDFRPATGQLYALGAGSRMYVINRVTGAAVQVGADGAFVLNGVAFGFDFNPVNDRIRVVSDNNVNLRLNPNDGTQVDGDPATPGVQTDTAVAYAAGDPNFGLAADIGGSAYTNNLAGATRTTLYDLDTLRNVIARQGSFNASPTSPNSGQLFTTGALGLNPTDDATRTNTAFDVFSPVQGVNIGYASATTNGTSSVLRSVDLVTGEATTIGTIGGGTPILVRALAAAPAGTFEFSAPIYAVGESGPVASITINRLRGSQGTVTVDFLTSNGTADNSDYTDADQTVTFNDGVTSQVVTIPITNDPDDENFAETILLTLRNATNGAFLGSQTSASLTITDNDTVTPTVTAQQSSMNVGLGEGVFNVATISGGVSPGGTVTFQVFGPNNADCSGAPIFTSIVPVSGNGNYVSSSFVPATPGLYRWTITYSGDGDHNGAVTIGCNSSNQSFTAVATVLGNIATRLRVETGDNILIAGFIITGPQNKNVIVRGIGASLPLADKLADPTLELRDGGGGLIEANDNWMDSPNKQAIIDSTIPPASDLESAIVASLPGNAAAYTAILRGANNGTGIGVVEAYDLDPLADSELANISTRGFVSTGDNVLIAGTIVVGKSSQKVIVRAIGPSLGLPNRMENPTLELRDGNGAVIEANDNWMDSPNKQAIIDSTIPPSNDLESAIVATLPGNNAGYTAIVRGANGSTGIAVVEIYALP